MAKEYFLALDERGLRLFDSKPHLEREESRPIHWQWVDNDGGSGISVGMGYGHPQKVMFRELKMNSYIKLIDFGEDGLFYPLRSNSI